MASDKMSGPMSGAAGAMQAKASQMDRPAAKSRINTGSVGSERPVSPKVDQMGGSAAEAGGLKASLKHAVAELHSQHPIRHDDIGPHHEDSSHMRHKPAIKPAY